MIIARITCMVSLYGGQDKVDLERERTSWIGMWVKAFWILLNMHGTTLTTCVQSQLLIEENNWRPSTMYVHICIPKKSILFYVSPSHRPLIPQ